MVVLDDTGNGTGAAMPLTEADDGFSGDTGKRLKTSHPSGSERGSSEDGRGQLTAASEVAEAAVSTNTEHIQADAPGSAATTLLAPVVVRSTVLASTLQAAVPVPRVLEVAQGRAPTERGRAQPCDAILQLRYAAIHLPCPSPRARVTQRTCERAEGRGPRAEGRGLRAEG